MMSNKCVYCVNGYHKSKQKPCCSCHDNPYYSETISKDLKSYFVKGEQTEMTVEDAEPWT